MYFVKKLFATRFLLLFFISHDRLLLSRRRALNDGPRLTSTSMLTHRDVPDGQSRTFVYDPPNVELSTMELAAIQGNGKFTRRSE